MPCGTHAADTNPIAHSPCVRLIHDAALVEKVVCLDAIGETEVAEVAAGFGAGDAVVKVIGADVAGGETIR